MAMSRADIFINSAPSPTSTLNQTSHWMFVDSRHGIAYTYIYWCTSVMFGCVWVFFSFFFSHSVWRVLNQNSLFFFTKIHFSRSFTRNALHSLQRLSLVEIHKNGYKSLYAPSNLDMSVKMCLHPCTIPIDRCWSERMSAHHQHHHHHYYYHI